MLLCNVKSEIIFIRHAPLIDCSRLFGLTDVEAKITNNINLLNIKNSLSNIDNFYSSPAKRCLQTLKAIWPEKNKYTQDKRLWEQNFGSWEGLSYSQIPNIGKLKNEDLANHNIPNGESFNTMCKRIQPAIIEIAKASLFKSSIVIAHAGTIRAAIGLALKSNFEALRFEINHLSITRIRVLENDEFSIISTNLNL